MVESAREWLFKPETLRAMASAVREPWGTLRDLGFADTEMPVERDAAGVVAVSELLASHIETAGKVVGP